MKSELTLSVSRPDVAAFVLEGAPAPLGIPAPLGKTLIALAAEEGFSGKEKELAVIYPCDAKPGRRVFLVGLGKKDKLRPDHVRQRAAALVKRANEGKSTALDLLLPGAKESPLDLPELVAPIVEAADLASYRYGKYKTTDTNDKKPLVNLNLVLAERRQLSDKLRRLVTDTETICAGVAWARDLVNEPPSRKTPEMIAELAGKLAVKGRITVKAYHKAEIEELGMGGLLAVAAGSHQPPAFVHLNYEPEKAKKTVVLVGKGITFDSGGLSLKPAASMNNMKDDMAGAAAVLGFFHALAGVDLPVKVHGLVALTENMPGGGATKIGDVFKALNGKTVEVLNTDAEGRLILADALAYGAKLKPNLMIDMATLTGACVVALGTQVTGVLGTAAATIQKLVELGRSTGESFWELPLFEGYREWTKSKVADLCNIGKPGNAGTIMAGLFLQEFVDQTPWVHLDIAGTAFTDDEKGYLAAGGTGVPIRTLFALLKGK